MATPGEGIGDSHAYYVCPYNKSHMIEGYKMHKHLLKCRQNYPSNDMKTCAYDVSHVVPEAEYNFHMMTCPKRTMLDMVKYNMDPAVDQARPVQQVPHVDSSENWEDEDFPGYKAHEQAAKQSNIIRRIHGATPSVRRDFRREQRQLHSSHSDQ